jgi:hypothetical protein
MYVFLTTTNIFTIYMHNVISRITPQIVTVKFSFKLN